MRLISVVEHLFRCGQCGMLWECQRHKDLLASQRQPTEVLFSCPMFDPIPCYTLSPDLRRQIEEDTGERLTCRDCCHSAQIFIWPQPLCGEGRDASPEGNCSELALRADQLTDYPIDMEE